MAAGKHGRSAAEIEDSMLRTSEVPANNGQAFVHPSLKPPGRMLQIGNDWFTESAGGAADSLSARILPHAKPMVGSVPSLGQATRSDHGCSPPVAR